MTRSERVVEDEKQTEKLSNNPGGEVTGANTPGFEPDESAGSSDETTIDPIAINVLMHEKRHFPPPPGFSEKAHIKSMAQYEEIYQRSVDDPEGFWGEMA